MLFISFVSGLCAAGVSLSPGILEALILFVGSFALVAVGLFMQGSVFIGLGYTIVYIGAIAVVFVFAVLVMDSHRTGSPWDQPPYRSAGVILMCLSLNSFPWQGKLIQAPNTSFNPQEEELSFLGTLSFGGGAGILLTVGFILLFVILGPILV